MNVPQGYKQTEVGVIPEDWDVKSIGDIFISYPNASYTREQLKNNGKVKYIHYGDIHTKYQTHLNLDLPIIPTVTDRQASRYTHLRNGDLILADASEDYAGVGKCVEIISDNNIDAISGLHTILLRDTKSIFVDRFRGYITQNIAVKSQLEKQAVGTKVYAISYNSIKECLLTIPTIEEQLKIAETLSDVDKLIAALDKKIAKKKLIKQAAMQQLLTGKKRLSNYHNSFVKIGLSELGNFVSGNGFPLQYQGNVVGDYPFYKVSDFNNKGNENHLSLANNYITKGISEKLKCNIIPKNSIIFAKIGAAIFLERKKMCLTDCCIDNNMMSFLPNENIDSSYICYFLQTVLFGELVETTALPSLGIKPLGEVIVNLPSTIKEQQAISKILSDIDEEIMNLERKRDKYQLLKSGMMQKLLTGQIRIK